MTERDIAHTNTRKNRGKSAPDITPVTVSGIDPHAQTSLSASGAFPQSSSAVYKAALEKYGADLSAIYADDIHFPPPGFGARGPLQDKDTIFAAFAQCDPTANDPGNSYRYLKWMAAIVCQEAQQGDTPVAAGYLPRLHSNLIAWERLRREHPEHDVTLETFKSFTDLQHKIFALNGMHDVTGDDLRQSASSRVMQETTVIYNGAEGFVVMPHSQRAAAHWCAGTTWLEMPNSTQQNLFYQISRNPAFVLYPASGGRYLSESVHHHLIDDLGVIQDKPKETLQALMHAASRRNPAFIHALKNATEEKIWPALSPKDLTRQILLNTHSPYNATSTTDMTDAFSEHAAPPDSLNALQERMDTKQLTTAQWDDPAIVSAVTEHAPWDFYKASARCRAMPDLIRAQIVKDPEAVKLAALDLQDDRHFVLSLVHLNGMVLPHIREEWQNQPDMVEAAVVSNIKVLSYLPQHVWDAVPAPIKHTAFTNAIDHNWKNIQFALDCDAVLLPRTELRLFQAARAETPQYLLERQHMFPSLRPACFVKTLGLDEAEHILKRAIPKDLHHGLRVISNQAFDPV